MDLMVVTTGEENGSLKQPQSDAITPGSNYKSPDDTMPSMRPSTCPLSLAETGSKYRCRHSSLSDAKYGDSNEPLESLTVTENRFLMYITNEDECEEKNVLPKYVYAAKFISKPMSNQHPVSRMRFGKETEPQKFYDVRRKKYDEIVQLHRATNTIISIFASSRHCLQLTLNHLTNHVATYLDNGLASPEAWIGIIAEVLKLISMDYLVFESAVFLKKKREMAKARHVVRSTLRQSTDGMLLLQRLIEQLKKVLDECERTIECISTGCRSRFYQSVWQTEVLHNSNGHGDSVGNMEDPDVNCSSSLSTSSLLSIHLLTPFIRWDVDGISIKKQVARSWPLIKYSTLPFAEKVETFWEIVQGFQAFLDVPLQNMKKALNALKETSSVKSRIEISLLDRQFRTILDVFLSDRYFHPGEQQKALVYAQKIKTSFISLYDMLERVKVHAGKFCEDWKRVFKQGDLSMASALTAVNETNISLWKSCKDFSFQLDFTPEVSQVSKSYFKTVPSKSQPCSLHSNPLEKTVAGFFQALVEHFDVLEDWEESYERRLLALRERKDLIISEDDVSQCTDLAQQLFFHFHSISNSLQGFSKELMAAKSKLLDVLPTDPPLRAIDSHFSPMRNSTEKKSEDKLLIVNIIGWIALVLEILHSTDGQILTQPSLSSLQKKCRNLNKSLMALQELLDSCVKNYSRMEKTVERILNHLEKYFKLLDDNVKVMSRVSSTGPMPVVLEDSLDQSGDSSMKTVMENSEGEVSIFVTVNGVYFNQFGVVFSSRLDGTSLEHRFRIVELFLNHTLAEVEETTALAKRILNKFGTPNASKHWWWQLSKSQGHDCMLIDEDLEKGVYNKPLFHLFKNIEAAFSKFHVKANFQIYSELEAIILIRTTRILEEEVVRFGQSCQALQQGVASLEKFRKYFKQSSSKFFRNGDFIPPFEKWNHKLSCYKLVIPDESLKLRLDKILTTSPSENASRSGSECEMAIGKEIGEKKVSCFSAMTALSKAEDKWSQLEAELLTNLKQRNAYLPEVETTVSNVMNIDFTPTADREFIGETEATAILIAHAVIQLKIEVLPKHLRIDMVKKLSNLCSKLKECCAIIGHSVAVSSKKRTKIIDRIHQMQSSYATVSCTHQSHHCEKSSPEAENTSHSGTDKNVAWLTQGSQRRLVGEEFGGEDVSDLDVFITLNFAFESLILSYRGYDRTTSFRSWVSRPHDQIAVVDFMIESISDRLGDVVDLARKVCREYVQLCRNLQKLLARIFEAFPLSLISLAKELKRLEDCIQNNRLIVSLQKVSSDLEVTEGHLKLALTFCEKHMEMTRDLTALSVNDSTIMVRNPLEKSVRGLFTKPIRIIAPCERFDIKLW